MARKVLITGAAGQLGKYLQSALKDKYNVIPTVRAAKKSIKYSNFKILNITKRNDVIKIINKIQPDIIINCAAYTNVDKSEKDKKNAHLINVEGVQNLIHASNNSTYFIQISTDYIFNGDAGPYSEKDHAYPINYYGRTKLEAENILIGSRRPFLIIRPNVIFSENLLSKNNFFAWVYKSLLNKKQIALVNDQISNPTYVGHLCEVILKCIILNKEGIYHFGTDGYISRYEFALAIADIFHLDKTLINSIETKMLARNLSSYIAKRPKHSGLSTNKIEDELDLPIYSIEYSLNMLKKQLLSS